MGDSRYKDNLTTLAKRLRPLMLQIAEGAVQANEWDRIIRISADSGGAELYLATAAGFTAALGDAIAGDMLWMPPAHISGDFSVPANVTVSSMGNDCIIDGKITLLGANSHLIGMVIDYSDSSAGTLVGVEIANSSDTAFLNNCGITVENTGAGDAVAILNSGAGEALIWDVNMHGNASGGGTGYALYTTSAGNAYNLFCKIQATSNGVDTNPFYTEYTYISEVLPEVLMLDLWDSDHNDSPPSDWETSGFDDSAWDPAVLAEDQYDLISGTDDIWSTYESDSGGSSEALFRHTFYIALDSIDSARFNVGANNSIENSYINGNSIVAVVGSVGAATASGWTAVAANKLNLKGKNVIAVHGEDLAVSWAWVAYILEINGPGGGIVYACDIQNEAGASSTLPRLGDRSAYWVDYDDGNLHGSDIKDAVLTRHLPAPGTSGNIPYDDGSGWVAGTPAEAGISSGPESAYWEPAVDADGDDILFTLDGDIAMVWIG